MTKRTRWAETAGNRRSCWWPMISVEALKKVCVLYEGDIYDLAQLLLKVNNAKDKVTNTPSRHTVHGLATAYCYLAPVEFDQIIGIFEKHGLPLGATVEHVQDIL